MSRFSFIFRHIGVEAAQTFSVLLKNAYILKPNSLRLAALDRGRRGLCDRGRPAALALNTPTVLQGKGAGKGEAWENTEASKQQPVTQTAAHTLQYCPHTVTMHKGGKVQVIWMLLSGTYCKKKSVVNVRSGGTEPASQSQPKKVKSTCHYDEGREGKETEQTSCNWSQINEVLFQMYQMDF